MLFRFSLYGFLKNQKYYEPFMILAFREKGLSFFMIGILIGFGKVCLNIMELPTGVIADLYGRRRCMIISFAAYICAFMLFALSRWVWVLFAAMLLYSLGDAFRTGTHKAMIFDWLKQQGKESEKTRFYGYTRSWSQTGSAVSVLIATAIVLGTQNYNAIFWFSAIPYIIGIFNFAGYPKTLDGAVQKGVSLSVVISQFRQALNGLWKNHPLRSLFGESMVFKGNYVVSKEYLQPLLKQAAAALPFFIGLAEQKRAAILVGGVFFVLYLLTGLASRTAHTFSVRAGGETAAARFLQIVQILLFVLLSTAFLLNFHWLAIAGFVMLALIQNIWTPILLSRIDNCTDSSVGATILSLDSQLEGIFVMIAAPITGLLVDSYGFWPLGVLGAITSLLAFMATTLPRKQA